MSETKTKINDEPVFKEPISADLPRRQFDRKLLESYDADHERIRNMSGRVTRIEAIFDSVNRDIRRLEETQKEMAGHLEQTASSMSAISNKLSVHTEMEEYQWTQVNKAHDILGQIGATLNDHLQQATGQSARLDWMERMIWALWGAVGTGAAMLVPLILKGMGT